ncbi:MAG: endonuclease/exonuclease/phosphatase family protein, partial [Fimbriimonadaceae bacterium]
LWFGDNPRRGLGVFTQLPTEVIEMELPRYVVPIQVEGPTPFLLIAVWAMPDKGDRYIRGVVRAMELCRHLIEGQPTVVLGDLNTNAIWNHQNPADRNHTALVQNLDVLGLCSAYHAHRDELHGEEKEPTFYLYRHENRPYHLDYCFLPNTWTVKSLSVGSLSEWKHLSDHVPLIVETEPGNPPSFAQR